MQEISRNRDNNARCICCTNPKPPRPDVCCCCTLQLHQSSTSDYAPRNAFQRLAKQIHSQNRDNNARCICCGVDCCTKPKPPPPPDDCIGCCCCMPWPPAAPEDPPPMRLSKREPPPGNNIKRIACSTTQYLRNVIDLFARYFF